MKRFFSVFLSLLLLAVMALPVFAAAPVSIGTVEDLELMRKNPTGSFRLDADLDLAGVDWKPIDFSGSFDGNGHALLNLTVNRTGDAVSNFWDGNLNSYPETRLAGLFGYLQDARVENLTLLGLTVDVESDADCFIGSIAGCAEDSSIENCTVSGYLTLRASARAEGVGGIVGFGGAGRIEDCTADVTLVCIDLDDVHLDEQFLGGVAGSGFLDANGCTVELKGYISEHGYVHSGGIMGLYRVYRNGWFEQGSIQRNKVNGFIRFFEDCMNRRAYCEALIGEQMTSYCEINYNDTAFTRDEIFTYGQDLVPHECEDPEYAAETVMLESGISCTRYSCQNCGDYAYLADYRLPGQTVEEAEELPEETQEPVQEEKPAETVPEVVAPAPEAPVQQEPAETEEAGTKQEQPELSDVKAAAGLVIRPDGENVEKADFPLHALVPVLLIATAAGILVSTLILVIKRK